MKMEKTIVVKSGCGDMLKKFLMNFVASLIVYFIASFIGLLAFLDVIIRYRGGNDISYTLLVFSTVISVALFFFLGRKLDLLGKHWLNYLSVSGSLIIAMMILVLGLFDSFLVFMPILSFVMLWIVVHPYAIETESNMILIMFLIATLPSIITWLGMLYASRKA